MAAPNFPAAEAFFDKLFADIAAAEEQAYSRIEAALAAAKAQIDAVAPGAADDIYATLEAKADAAKAALESELADLRAAVDPRAMAETIVKELLEAVRTGQSAVRQPPTNLAG